MRHIPLHLEALMESVDGAVILAQSINFQDLVVDAQIIAASPEAARLYGYNHPSELEGRFTSQLDHPDDYRAIKIMSVIRVLELSTVPSEYDVRIILPDGAIRYVRKQVRQMYHEGSAYWMTRSEEISPDQAKPLPDFSVLLTQNMIRSWFGAISVSELEELVKRIVPARNSQMFGKNLTCDEIHHIMDEFHREHYEVEENGRMAILPIATVSQVVDLGLGKTRILPDNRYIHRCGNCAETWASSVRNPQKCPRSREDSRGPKCATSRWRVVTERGLACARQQDDELSKRDHSD